MMNNLVSFPVPIHEGKTVLWHLSSILSWAKRRNRYQIDELLLDVANAKSGYCPSYPAPNFSVVAEILLAKGFK